MEQRCEWREEADRCSSSGKRLEAEGLEAGAGSVCVTRERRPV